MPALDGDSTMPALTAGCVTSSATSAPSISSRLERESSAACSSKSSDASMSRDAKRPILPVAPTTATAYVTCFILATAAAPGRPRRAASGCLGRPPYAGRHAVPRGRRHERRRAGTARRVLRRARVGLPRRAGRLPAVLPDGRQFTPPAGCSSWSRTTARPIGCGGIRRIEPHPGTQAERFEVKHLWLRAAARGRGWGRRLLDELERRAIAFGARELVLDTNASLEAAGGALPASGYVEIEPYNDNPNATHWYGKRVG